MAVALWLRMVLAIALWLVLMAVAGRLLALAVALRLAVLAVARLLRLRRVLFARLFGPRLLLLVLPVPAVVLLAVAVRLGRLMRSPPVRRSGIGRYGRR